MSRRHKNHQLPSPFPHGHRNSDLNLQQYEQVQIESQGHQFFRKSKHQAQISGGLKINNQRGKSLDMQGAKTANSKNPPVIVEEQMNKTGFQSGSINVGTMFREDQSEAVMQSRGDTKPTSSSLRDRTFKAQAN